MFTSDVPVLSNEDLFDRVEGHHLLKKVEARIAGWCMREVRNGAISWPGNDGDEEDAGDDCALDPVHHEEGCEYAAAEDAEPESWVSHLAGLASSIGAKE